MTSCSAFQGVFSTAKCNCMKCMVHIQTTERTEGTGMGEVIMSKKVNEHDSSMNKWKREYKYITGWQSATGCL